MSENRKKLFDFDDYEKPSIWRRMYLRWEHEWKYIPKKIKYGIENIIFWFKIIWNDRSWSPNYFYDIIIHKIEALEHDVDNYSGFVSKEDNLKYLRLSKKLLRRISDEYYFGEWHEYYETELYQKPYTVPDDADEEYLEFIGEGTEGLIEIESEVIEDNLDDYFEKYARELQYVLEDKPHLDINDEGDRGSIGLQLAIRIHKKSKRIAFKILEEKIGSWWI